jgi:hypothetical protein
LTIELVLPSVEQSTVRVNCYDTVRGEQLVAMNQIVVSCTTCRYQLWNFTRVERLFASQEHARKLALQSSAIPHSSALEGILVVGQQQSVRRLATKFRRYSSNGVRPQRDRELLTFTCLDEAVGWIDGRPALSKAAPPRVRGRSVAAKDKEKRVGIPPVPNYVDYYLNIAQKTTLARCERMGWRVAFVRRLGYTRALVVMSNRSGSHYAALKEDGTVSGSIELVVRESDFR